MDVGTILLNVWRAGAELAVELAHQRPAGGQAELGAGGDHAEIRRGLCPVDDEGRDRRQPGIPLIEWNSDCIAVVSGGACISSRTGTSNKWYC